MVLGSHVFRSGTPVARARGAPRDRAPALSGGAGPPDHRLRAGRTGVRRARRHGRLAGEPRRRAGRRGDRSRRVPHGRQHGRCRRRRRAVAAGGVAALSSAARALPGAPRRPARRSASRPPTSSGRSRTGSSASCGRRRRAPRSSWRSRRAACGACRPARFRPRRPAELGPAASRLQRGRATLQTALRLVRNGRMRNLAIRLAVVPMVFVLSCSCSALASSRRQTSRPPTISTVAKQNLLSSPPTPRYPVNADLDGKVVFLGLDVDPLPAEGGKDLKLTQYWKVVSRARRRLEDVHARRGPGQAELRQRRPRPRSRGSTR